MKPESMIGRTALVLITAQICFCGFSASIHAGDLVEEWKGWSMKCDPKGHILASLNFGEFAVGAYRLPISLLCRSNKDTYSDTLPGVWRLPTFESKVVQLDEKNYSVTFPDGRIATYRIGKQRNDEDVTEDFKISGSEVTVQCDNTEFIFSRGRLLRIISGEDSVEFKRLDNGSIELLRSAGGKQLLSLSHPKGEKFGLLRLLGSAIQDDVVEVEYDFVDQSIAGSIIDRGITPSVHSISSNAFGRFEVTSDNRGILLKTKRSIEEPREKDISEYVLNWSPATGFARQIGSHSITVEYFGGEVDRPLIAAMSDSDNGVRIIQQGFRFDSVRRALIWRDFDTVTEVLTIAGEPMGRARRIMLNGECKFQASFDDEGGVLRASRAEGEKFEYVNGIPTLLSSDGSVIRHYAP